MTCGREAFTRDTLRSFTALHPDARDFFRLLHADDASESQENCLLAYEHGFETVHVPKVRKGQMASLRALAEVAWSEGFDWYLHLENDWLWERPVPLHVMGSLDDIGCLRLHHKHKAKNGPRKGGGVDTLEGGEPVVWETWGHHPGFEVSWRAHWGGPPSIVRLDLLRPQLHHDRVLEVARHIIMPVVRVQENCIWHMNNGFPSTPDYQF